MLPPKAIHLLNESNWLQIGISNDNDSDVIYFNSISCPNTFLANLGNEAAKQVHASYQNRQFHDLFVGIPVAELSAQSVQRVKMYYIRNNYIMH